MTHRPTFLRRSAGLLRYPALAGMALALASPSQNAAMQSQVAKSSSASSPPASHSRAAAKADNPSNASVGDVYVIGRGDLLSVSVWKDVELSRTMPVRPDGRISLPLIGEIQAAGLTTPQLQQAILLRLNSYMSNPQVNVIVQEIRSRSFNVVGKVNKPGAFELTTPKTVLDAIAQAGGFQDFARVTKVYVLRHTTDGHTTTLPFNYRKVIKGKALDQNVVLQPGDTIVVP